MNQQAISSVELLRSSPSHEQIGVHAGGEHGEIAEAARLFGHQRMERETAQYKNLKAKALYCFFGRLFDLLPAHGAVLGTDGHGHAAHVARGVGVLARRLEPGAA